MMAVHQDASGNARALALSYAWAQGYGRGGIIESSFREETETDLFAEQAVLCGGITHLIRRHSRRWWKRAMHRKWRTFPVCMKIKLMADMIYDRGIAGMRESISATAEFGDYTRGPRVIGEASAQQ